MAGSGRLNIWVLMRLEHPTFDINLPESSRSTPLYSAACDGRAESVALLVVWGAKAHTQREYRCNPATLQRAAGDASTTIVEYLIKKGPILMPSRPTLHICRYRKQLLEGVEVSSMDFSRPGPKSIAYIGCKWAEYHCKQQPMRGTQRWWSTARGGGLT